MNLAYQRDVDGCVDACFVWRAAIYDAFKSGQSICLASNDQSKCFDRFQFGVQLLQLRLVWGTVPHSAIAALAALGLSVTAANAALGAALESIAHDNMLINRLRRSSPTRWRGA